MLQINNRLKLIKKLLPALLLLIIIFPAGSDAYQKAFDDEIKIAQAGVVLTGVAGGYGEDILFPPLNLTLEYGKIFNRNVPLSFGVTAAYARDYHTEKAGGAEYKWTYDYWFLAFRSAFHFTEIVSIDNLDLYAGIVAGWIFADYNFESSNNSQLSSYKAKGDRFTAGLFAGARYYLTKNIALFGEISIEGLGLINIGASMKF